MILTKEYLRKVEACSPLLPDPGPEVVEELLGHIWSVQAEFDKRIADLERQRDTAHAEAINAAAQICEDWSTSCWDSFRDQAMAVAQRAVNIRALTPAHAQRCYDLRIAEAVRDEAKWWEYLFCYADTCDMFNKVTDGRQRLASASAEVERLQSQELNTKGESA